MIQKEIYEEQNKINKLCSEFDMIKDDRVKTMERYTISKKILEHSKNLNELKNSII